MQFDQDAALESIGGAGYLVKLAESVVTVISARDYAEAILDLAIRRQVILAAAEAMAMARVDEPSEWGKRGRSIIERLEARLRDRWPSPTGCNAQNRGPGCDGMLCASPKPPTKATVGSLASPRACGN
jgi:hypothetical protein